MGSYSELDTATQEELDCAKRLSDIINGLVVFTDFQTLVHSWIAVRLSDGGSDRTLYDSRANAVRFTAGGPPCAYLSLRFCAAGMQVREAFAFLRLQRDAYNARDVGIQLVDPEAPNGGHDFMTPLTNEDVRREMARFNRQRASRGRGRK